MPIDVVPFPYFEKYEINERSRTTRLRSLRFDLNALADFEQEVGMGFAQLMQMKAAFATVRAMVWAGLKWNDRALTIERVGELIGKYIADKDDPGSIDTLLTLCIQTAMDQGALGRPRQPGAEAEATTKPVDEMVALPPAIDVTPTSPTPIPKSSDISSEMSSKSVDVLPRDTIG